MSNMLILFSNFTINVNNVITLVTRAKSRIVRRVKIRFNAKSERNTLLDLSNELLNLIFEITCTRDSESIRVSDSIT